MEKRKEDELPMAPVWVIMLLLGLIIGATIGYYSAERSYDEKSAIARFEDDLYMRNLPSIVSGRIHENLTIKGARALYEQNTRDTARELMYSEIQYICTGSRWK